MAYHFLILTVQRNLQTYAVVFIFKNYFLNKDFEKTHNIIL